MMSSEKQSNKERMRKIVKGSIDRFNLNLDGFTIFTEAASGIYAYIPVIAGLANAKMVYAIAKDSKYGRKE